MHCSIHLCALLIPLAVLASTTPASAQFTALAQDTIVPAGAQAELLWADGEFTEGGAADRDGSLFFSDIGNRIMRHVPQTGETTVYREPSGRANGMAFDKQGRLFVCEGANTGGGRRISVTETDGTVRTLADRWQGKRFNSPNDLCIAPNGNVYFTDPRYVGNEPREIDFEGVFLVKPDGTVHLATREMGKPNGIQISGDGTRIYIVDNGKVRQLASFRVRDDGTLEHKRILFDSGTMRGMDGMTLDRAGNIYAAGGAGEATGIYVFSPAGRHLAFIPIPGSTTNCVFGTGGEAKTLYVTARVRADKGKPAKYGLYRIRL